MAATRCLASDDMPKCHLAEDAYCAGSMCVPTNSNCAAQEQWMKASLSISLSLSLSLTYHTGKLQHLGTLSLHWSPSVMSLHPQPRSLNPNTQHSQSFRPKVLSRSRKHPIEHKKKHQRASDNDCKARNPCKILAKANRTRLHPVHEYQTRITV